MKTTAFLDAIERAGNRLPNPTVLFIVMSAVVIVLSAVCALIAVSAIHPATGEELRAVNLLSGEGLRLVLANTVSNFIGFAPVGSVLVAIMGIGVAEHSGLISTLLRATVLKAPRRLLTFSVVLAGVLSSVAMDAGYVVLIPLAALIFQAAGRHPLAGIAAAFAGVSGGYSANILLTPLDAILAGISTEAASLIDQNYHVHVASNYYFLVVSTLFISVVGTLMTELVVCRRLPDSGNPQALAGTLSAPEKRGLIAVGIFTFVVAAMLLWGLLPQDGVLRDPGNQPILSSPVITGIVTVIAIYAALAGILFGKVSGNYKKSSEFVEGMEQNMALLAGYLVLMFFAAQFVSYFAWSNLGAIIAINGAALLNGLNLSTGLVLVAFIFVTAVINLFIGSASAKWALIAPIFIPMLMLNGISPEATQVAFRIGDSSTNIITPLMPYVGVVIAFVQRYDKHAGIGTLVAMMLPYSIAFLLCWSTLLLFWILMDWPLGPGAHIFLH